MNFQSFTKKILSICILILMVFAIIYSLSKVSVFNNDNYFMFETGKLILSDGFVTEDPLSMHDELAFMYPQWLFSVIIYLLKTYLGNTACMWFIISIFVIFSILLYKIHLRLSENQNTALLTTILSAGITAMMFLKIRPFMVSTCLAALDIYLIEKYLKEKKKNIFILIFLTSALCINFHNTIWIFLFLIHLCYIGEAIILKILKRESEIKIKDILLITLISFAGGAINPYGLSYISYIFTAMKSIEPFIGQITELQISSFSNSMPLYILFGLTSIAVILLRKKIKIRFLLLFIGTAIMAFAARRNQMLFFAFGLMIIPCIMKNINIKYIDMKVLKNGSFLLLIITSLILMINVRVPEYQKGEAEQYEAVDWLSQNETNKDVKIFNCFSTGSYLEYKGFHPYIDPRAEVFGIEYNKKDDIASEYMNAIKNNFSNFDQMIEKYDFDYYIIPYLFTEKVICDYLDQYPEKYKVVYEDDMGRIYRTIRESDTENSNKKKITWENVDYESVPIYINGKKGNIKDIISNELTVIYIGRDTCKDCLRIEPEVKKILEEKNIPYIRIKILEDDTTPSIEYEIDRSIVVGLGIKEVPAFIILKDKSTVDLYEGDLAIENIKQI